MAFKVLIASQQASVSAALTTQFTVVAGKEVTVSSTALVVDETAIITYSADFTTIPFVPAFSEGVALVLSATQPQVVVRGAGHYRVSKATTVSACAINLHATVI